MNDFIGLPNLKISAETIKNRALLLIKDARINTKKSILKAPAAMVNTL